MKSGEIKGSYELPEGWRWARLEEVCEKPQYGYTASAEYATVGPKFLRITDIQNGKVNWDTVPYCRCEKGVDHYLLRPGDILFARTGGTTGKSYLISKPPLQAIFASYLIRVRTGNTIIPEYLYQFLQSGMYWEQVESSKRGGAQPNMNATLLSRITLPIPTLEEQQRIASKLHELMREVERARTACEQQLEAAKVLPAAYLRTVFESEEAKSWERKRLGEVCEIILGQSPPGSTYNRENIGLPFFQGKIDFGLVYPVPSTWCSKPIKIAQPSDILISLRAPVGPTNMANQKCCIGRGLAAIRPNGNIAPGFVFYFFRFIESDLSEKYGGRGSTFGAMTREHLQELEIPLPPLPEQKRFSTDLTAKMSEVEKLRQSIENRLQAINALPQAILRKAFQGEL